MNRGFIILEKEKYKYMEEMYVEHYKCKNCNEIEIFDYHKFCPMCGVEIKWGEDWLNEN